MYGYYQALQASRYWNRSCGTSACVLSRSLYRSHVLSTFFGPVLGAMMKQVCWHPRRSEAHRGLPEARPRTQNVMARGQSEAHGDSLRWLRTGIFWRPLGPLFLPLFLCFALLRGRFLPEFVCLIWVCTGGPLSGAWLVVSIWEGR